MMGQSGKAGVAFDYRAGAIVGRAQLARSSGTPVLDAAALTAVRMAHYPEAQPGDSNQLLHLLIWVEEACSG
jgi:protein TonB